VIRGQRTSADFYVDGMRDDAEYLRDTYNVERVEALKGPNAMIFGRGGGGGVINRVEKEAQWVWTRSLTAEAGTYDHRRGMLDVGGPVASSFAARFNGVYEDGKGFRDFADRKRWGVNPTGAVTLGERATLNAGFEFYRDGRNVDRGIPSFQGGPANTPIDTYFGNPGLSTSISRVHSANAGLDLTLPAGFTVRSKARWADYDKFYQNSYAGGAVNAAGTSVNLSAYNNSIERDNWIGQTDVLRTFATGFARHTLLAGADVTRSATRGFRNTGYYNNTSTSLAVPVNQPTVTTPITFRQSATDADYFSTNSATGIYAQDQIALGRRWQVILGLRHDWFGIEYDDHRTDAHLGRDDAFTSPRAGLVFKPVESASLYGSYSVSQLPSSGDAAARLTITTETLEPEKFTSGELGAKWDVRPDLAVTGAVFRLDRTNTTAPDPSDPTRVVQTGSQRSEGFELGVTGNVTSAWQIAGGFTGQRAEITSRTAAAAEGAKVQLVPGKQLSLWNRYQIVSELGVGAGVIRQSRMFAAIDNTVTLPGFTRVDAAVFLTPLSTVTAQLNVENLFDRKYYGTSNGNNNIMPGAPRTLRVSLSVNP
jgi:catecholate siderophore receptor